MRSTTVIHRKLADTPRSPRRRPAADRRPRPLREELEALAARVEARSPNWRDPETFTSQKLELVSRLHDLIWRTHHD
jgi:hypothetical protein